jgi:hypothetical protein
MAVGLSLLWHLFWFFSITITVSPPKSKVKTRPRIVSLGPALDDTIFRTLVETKPEFSKTFYRQMSEFAVPTEPAVKTIERHSPGDVVSVPMGKKFLTSLKDLVGGSKVSPDFDFAPSLGKDCNDQTLTLEERKDC